MSSRRFSKTPVTCLPPAIQANVLNLKIIDNGHGFRADDALPGMGGHFGLIGIRERAERLGGEFRLDSQPGAGTEVEVTVPLP